MSNFLKKKKEQDKKKDKKAPKKEKNFEQHIKGDEDEDVGIKIGKKAAVVKEEEQEPEKPQINVVPKEIQQVSWDETKQLDEQDVTKNNINAEPEVIDNGKKSWVPQMQKKDVSGFNTGDAYLPSLGDPDAEKNAPKEEPKIQRNAAPAAPGRPMFTNSKKGGVNNNAPLQMSIQQQKELEMEKNLNIAYKTTNPTDDSAASGIKFGGPTRFTNSGAGLNKNQAPIELTPQQLKELEMENKLLEKKAYKQPRPEGAEQQQEEDASKQFEFKSGPIKFGGAGGQKKVDNTAPLQLSVQQQKELEAEEKLKALKEQRDLKKEEDIKAADEKPTIGTGTEGYKSRFTSSKGAAGGNFKPLEKTEQQKKLEELENKKNEPVQEKQEEKTESGEQQQRPAMRFTNSKKATNNNNFKQLEKTEQQKKMEEIEKKLEEEKAQKKKEFEERKQKKQFKNKQNPEEKEQQKEQEEEEQKTEDGWQVAN